MAVKDLNDDGLNELFPSPLKTNPYLKDIDDEFQPLWAQRAGISPKYDPRGGNFENAYKNWDKINPNVLKYGSNEKLYNHMMGNRDYYQRLSDYQNGLKKDMDAYQKSDAFKESLLNAALNKKGAIPYEMYRNSIIKNFKDRYGYDDTLNTDEDSFTFGIGNHEGPSMQSPLLRTNTLRNAMNKGIIDLDDIIRYIAKNSNRYKGW